MPKYWEQTAAQKRYARAREKQLRKNGHVMEYDSGSTFNDGGSWHTWIYRHEGLYYRVHQPSDYVNDYLIERVKRKTVENQIWVSLGSLP